MGVRSPPPAPAFVFTKNLKLGDRGEDVRELQKFLNQQGFNVAESGAGSPKNETTLFGPKTKQALIRFQEKYKDEILTPVGLKKGTGYFGSSTRKKVNDLLVKTAPLVPPPLASVTTPPPASSAGFSEQQRQSLIKELKEKIKQLTIQLLELQLKLLQEQLRGR